MSIKNMYKDSQNKYIIRLIKTMRKDLSNINPDEKKIIKPQTSIYKTTNYTKNKNIYNYTIYSKFLKKFAGLNKNKNITLCKKVINILCKYLKYLRLSKHVYKRVYYYKIINI